MGPEGAGGVGAGAEAAGAAAVFDATVVELSPPPQPLNVATPITLQKAHPVTLNFRFMDES